MLTCFCSIVRTSRELFFRSGVIMEPCEATRTCRVDHRNFKPVYLRNLAYVYRQTNDPEVRDSIRTMIDRSLAMMIAHACDDDWNCADLWSSPTRPVREPFSQHVAASLLVAALAIHTRQDEGLLPPVPIRPLPVLGDPKAGHSLRDMLFLSAQCARAPSSVPSDRLTAAQVARLRRVEYRKPTPAAALPSLLRPLPLRTRPLHGGRGSAARGAMSEGHRRPALLQ